jgi:hypothetical protein
MANVVRQPGIRFVIAEELLFGPFLKNTGNLRFAILRINKISLHSEKILGMLDAELVRNASRTFRHRKKMNRIQQIRFPNPILPYNAINL